MTLYVNLKIKGHFSITPDSTVTDSRGNEVGVISGVGPAGKGWVKVCVELKDSAVVEYLKQFKSEREDATP